MVVYICRCYFLHLSHSLLSVLTFQQTSIYQCQLFKTFSISQPSCIFIQPVNYENLPQKKLYDFFKWLSSFSSYQLFSLTLYNSMECSIPGLPIHHQLPEFTQTQVHWVSDAIQTSHPLSSTFPPAFNLSQHQGLFKGVSSSHQVVKVWDLSFNNSSSNEHPGLISFRMDGLDLLAAQGNLKSLLQHHSSKASILQCSAFFIV